MIEITLKPELYPMQREAIFNEKRYSLIEASTKSGKTTGCLQWIVERACRYGDGANHWWVAPVYSQVLIAFRRMQNALRPFKAHGFEIKENALRIIFPNGANVYFRSATNPDNLYGEDVYSCVMDEASRCRDTAFDAVRSTLTKTGGFWRLIGNVKGRKNRFYQMARMAEGGAANMHYAKLTAYDAVAAGVLSAEEIEDAKAQLPENVFRELYLAEPSDDEGNPFGVSAINACLATLSSDAPCVYGVDLAKSIDWTVCLGLDGQGQTCRFDRWQKVPWDETIVRLQNNIGTIKALVDSSGLGDPVFEQLKKTALLAEEHPLRKEFKILPNYHDYKFTQSTKQKLMEGLAVAIQSRSITFPEGHIARELRDFEYKYTRTGVLYSAPEGFHDDCVIALGLAVAGRTQFASQGSKVSVSVDLSEEDLFDAYSSPVYEHEAMEAVF